LPPCVGATQGRHRFRSGDQGNEETQMSKLGAELVQSMAQALAQGKRTKSRTHKVEVKPEEVQKARKQLGLSLSDRSRQNSVEDH
jgi:hypothetical protein